jgi:uncharacterized phage protein (TIGR02218 family)
MTYATNIAAAQQESTPELYEFLLAGEYERFTSFAQAVTFLGHEFTPRSIRRSGWNYDTEFGAVSLSITAPITETFRRYIVNMPVEPVKVTIYRALSSDMASFVTIFNGYIRTVSIRDNMAQAECESRSKVLRAKIPRIVYQAYCNHNVFDAGCTLNDETWRVAATISNVSGSTIVSASFAGYPAQWFRGGFVQLDLDYRLITDHTADTLSLQLPFDDRMAVGTAVYAYPGCDGNPATCRDKFDNLEHYLGMAYIPSSNPVVWGPA